MNLQKTEEIRLKDSKTAFAFGLTCPSKNTTKYIRELLLKHIIVILMIFIIFIINHLNY